MVLYVCENASEEYAEEIASELEIPEVYEKPEENSAFLILNENGLSFSDNGNTVAGDFTRLLKRTRNGNLFSEDLVRACKIKGLERPALVYDATAGLGDDSFLLASAGFEVVMFERDKIIAALLADALKRGRDIPAVSHMKLIKGDSIKLLPSLLPHPDAVLLDPMFPEKQKSSLVKKKFQLLHILEKPCEDEELLLEAAKSALPRKIIIKRPAKGPFLGNIKPDYSYNGKNIRYDVIALQTASL